VERCSGVPETLQERPSAGDVRKAPLHHLAAA
jgi:hypothetical protein